jgi:hypothetical protein
MKSVLKGKGVVSRDSQKGGEVITLGDGRKVSFISRYLSLFPKSVPLLSLPLSRIVLSLHRTRLLLSLEWVNVIINSQGS